MTMLEVYKALVEEIEKLSFDTYAFAQFDAGYLRAAADLVKDGALSEEDHAAAKAFDDEVVNRRLMKAIAQRSQRPNIDEPARQD